MTLFNFSISRTKKILHDLGTSNQCLNYISRLNKDKSRTMKKYKKKSGRKRKYFQVANNVCITCSAGAFSPIAIVFVENAIRAADRFNDVIAIARAG